MRTLFYALLLTVFILPVFAQQETLTITTYYPAPHGIYKEIRVHDRMSVGDPNTDGVINEDDLGTVAGIGSPIPGSLTARIIGINTTSPTGALHVVGLPEDGGLAGVTAVFEKDNYLRFSSVHILNSANPDPANKSRLDLKGMTSIQERVFLTLQAGFNVTDDATRNSLAEFKQFNSGAYETIMAFNGGEVGVGTTSPSDGTAAGGEQLKLDVEGAVGATHYCDEDGENCVTPPIGGGNPVIGTYLGNNNTVSGKDINIGFRPRVVRIIGYHVNAPSAQATVCDATDQIIVLGTPVTVCSGGGAATDWKGQGYVGAITFNANGFTVKHTNALVASPNKLSLGYEYTAWR